MAVEATELINRVDQLEKLVNELKISIDTKLAENT